MAILLNLVKYILQQNALNRSHFTTGEQAYKFFKILYVTCALQARFKLNKDPTSAIRKCNLSSLLQKIICVRNNMCPLI